MGTIARAKFSAPAEGPESLNNDSRQYLTFMLGTETLALDILAIKEIIEYGEITSVPMMPPFIRGVINLRGSVVPVIDLSVRFGHNAHEVTRRTCIVIMEVHSAETSYEVGAVVDAVNEVLNIPLAEIEKAPSFGSKIRADFISGMGKIGDKFIIILNNDKVLSFEEISLLSELREKK